MDERGRQEPVDADAEEHADDPEGAISTHESRPGRVVFTEDGNTDGWIATDLVVDPEP